MTLPSLVTPSFWFSTVPMPFSFWTDRVLIVLSLAFSLVGIIGLVYLMRASIEKRVRRVYQSTAWQLIWIGLVGLLLWSFTYERVPVLSMRFAWIVWLGWIAWVVWSTWRRLRIELPAESERYAERDRLAKWLPKKKL